MTRVSVVMAAYQGAAFIGEQIASILSELGEQDELIVSLDPSTDGTAEIVARFGDSRLRLIDGPGKGVIKNFESGLGQAKGAYIFLSDQDDIWHSGKVEKVLYTFEQSGSAAVMHDARIVDTARNVIEPSFFAWRGCCTGMVKNLIKNSYIGCCMAFKRELLPFILPFPEKLPMHDQWIGLQAERHGGVTLLAEPLLDYRRHGGNVSSDRHASAGQMLRWRLELMRALHRKQTKE